MRVQPSRLSPEEAKLEFRMQEWRRLALLGQPTANPDYVRTVSEEIIRRAKIISEQSPVRFLDVAVFFLERTESWLMQGLPMTSIGPRLPKNVTELGLMKMAEGSAQIPGGALTAEELKAVAKSSRKIIN